MRSYFLRRLIQFIPSLFIISIIAFFVMRLAPGDPIAMYANPEKRTLSVEEIQYIRHKIGLDQPIYVQYYKWLVNTLQGDWGYSLQSKAPVTKEILSRLPNTLLLAGCAFLVTIFVGIPIGVLSAIKRYTLFDYLSTIMAFIGISMPGFWLAMILIELLSNRLGLLPPVGMQTFGRDMTGFAKASDLLLHLIMPVLTLSFLEMAYWARYQRSSLLEVLGQDYIRTARAKGANSRRLIWKHAMRNALISMVTIAGLTLPDLVNGSYIVETIFGWPGMGRLGVSAIIQRDYPIVMGVTMLSALVVIIGNFLADFLYVLIDPRIQQR